MNWTHVFLETPLGKEEQMWAMSCGSPHSTRQRLGLSHCSPQALEPPVAAAWEPCAATALLLVAACNQPWHWLGLLELPWRSFSWLSPQELLQHLHKKLVHVLVVCKWVRVAEELEKTLLGLSHKGLLLWAADPVIGKAWSFILETESRPQREVLCLSSPPFPLSSWWLAVKGMAGCNCFQNSDFFPAASPQSAWGHIPAPSHRPPVPPCMSGCSGTSERLLVLLLPSKTWELPPVLPWRDSPWLSGQALHHGFPPAAWQWLVKSSSRTSQPPKKGAKEKRRI